MSYSQYDPLIFAAAAKYGVDPPTIKATIMTESSFNPNAYRAEPAINDGSYGLMQVLFRTAVSLGFPNDPAQHTRLFDPATNIDLGTHLLSQLQNRYSDVDQIYAAYNSGAVRKNAAGLYVNTKGETSVQARVDRFMSFWIDFKTEYDDAQAQIAQDAIVNAGSPSEPVDDGGTSGEVAPEAIAGIVMIAILGYVAYKYFM